MVASLKVPSPVWATLCCLNSRTDKHHHWLWYKAVLSSDYSHQVIGALRFIYSCNFSTSLGISWQETKWSGGAWGWGDRGGNCENTTRKIELCHQAMWDISQLAASAAAAAAAVKTLLKQMERSLFQMSKCLWWKLYTMPGQQQSATLKLAHPHRYQNSFNFMVLVFLPLKYFKLKYFIHQQLPTFILNAPSCYLFWHLLLLYILPALPCTLISYLRFAAWWLSANISHCDVLQLFHRRWGREAWCCRTHRVWGNKCCAPRVSQETSEHFTSSTSFLK